MSARAVAVLGVLAVLLVAGPLARGAVIYETYTNRADFVARVAGAVSVVDFDDIDTSPAAPVAFAANRYSASLGIVIAAEGGGGQYADETFAWAAEFPPVSAPNMYAAGPPWGDERTTLVTFVAGGGGGRVAAFGLYFIDPDWPDWPAPGQGACSLTILDEAGSELAYSGTVSGPNASQVFFGYVAIDDGTGALVPVIAEARIVAGSGWPEYGEGEVVTLDDFTFTPPVPEPATLALVALGGLGLLAGRRRP